MAFGRLLTPDFASPEQVRGERVTTASDVYSLGVILYLLVTGDKPYRVDTTSLTEVERVVCEQVPATPSASLGSGNRKSISADLDWITLKALEKDPDRRYGSAAELMDDLKRHLSFEPVHARPPSTTYRLGRFLRRNRAGVMAAAIATVALLAGVLLAVTGFVRATRARDIAQRDAASSHEVTAFLQEMLSSVQPDSARGREVTVREVLDEAALNLGERFAGDPEVEAAIRHTIGDSYQALGDFETALPFLEKAVEIRRRELSPTDPRFIQSLDVLGMVYWLTGNFEGSFVSSEEVLRLREMALGRNHPDYTQTLGNLANTYADSGDLKQAERLVRQALAIERRILVGDDRKDLAYTTNSLGTILSDQERFDEAIEFHLESRALRLEFMGEDSPEHIISLNNLGRAYYGAGDLNEAESHIREAVRLGEQVFGPGHLRVASAKINLAEVLGDDGQLVEAEELAREALGYLNESLGEQNWRSGAAHAVLGRILYLSDRVDEARDKTALALEILSSTLGADHGRTKEVSEQMRLFAP